LKKTHHKRRLGGMAEGVGPEFRLEKKKTKKKEEEEEIKSNSQASRCIVMSIYSRGNIGRRSVMELG
jgi:hypothetical protein